MAMGTEVRGLVLWDIDHTLIETCGVGAELYEAAFEETTGRNLEHRAEVTGLTEPAIFRESLRLNGLVEREGDLTRYAAALTRQYASHLDELTSRGRALPGARAALSSVGGSPGLLQSVLTGNLRAVSLLKLSAFDLQSYVDLDAGAFGDDDEVRARLVRVAQDRAEASSGGKFGPGNTLVVGDSSSDVETGQKGGARVLAVASGRASSAELASAGADEVVDSLADTVRVLELIHGLLSH